MIETKFRAWIINKSLMRDVECLRFGDRGYGKQFLSIATFHDKNIDYPDFILMQFTGQLDKNGKEIFESDNVKYATGDSERPYITEEVVYQGGAFYPICTQPSNTFEVIDNIYEVIKWKLKYTTRKQF